MKVGDEIQISVREYARQLHVDEKAVRNAIKAGKIKKGYVKKTGKIKASIATEEWGFIHKHPKAGHGISRTKAAEKIDKIDEEKNIKINADGRGWGKENINSIEKEYTYIELIKEIKITPILKYSEAVRRKEILSIAREKMELEEKQQTLVRKSDVEKALFAIGDQLKKSLLNIPARCIDDIIAAPNKIEANNILTFEINQVLITISQLHQ